MSLGHEDAVEWINSPPVYHLEVKTTAGHVTSDFALTNAEFERVRSQTSYHGLSQDLDAIKPCYSRLWALTNVYKLGSTKYNSKQFAGTSNAGLHLVAGFQHQK